MVPKGSWSQKESHGGAEDAVAEEAELDTAAAEALPVPSLLQLSPRGAVTGLKHGRPDVHWILRARRRAARARAWQWGQHPVEARGSKPGLIRALHHVGFPWFSVCIRCVCFGVLSPTKMKSFVKSVNSVNKQGVQPPLGSL